MRQESVKKQPWRRATAKLVIGLVAPTVEQGILISYMWCRATMMGFPRRATRQAYLARILR
ncbi:hypothetical protein Hdeb2414_s0036g00730271 [Helianthus debilis subsp. tardiflorus]